jgi:hypothetical protein
MELHRAKLLGFSSDGFNDTGFDAPFRIEKYFVGLPSGRNSRRIGRLARHQWSPAGEHERLRPDIYDLISEAQNTRKREA